MPNVQIMLTTTMLIHKIGILHLLKNNNNMNENPANDNMAIYHNPSKKAV